MRRVLRVFLLTALCSFLLVAPAHALEYTVDSFEGDLFGRPTSDETLYTVENPNVDRGKNTALIPPGFGTPTSYLPGSGEYLTPNLVPGALSGGLVNQIGGGTAATDSYPTVDAGGDSHFSYSTAYTEVTSDLYYTNGRLGTLKIPAIGLTVGIYQGTGSTPLSKGAGHFENTSIWDGNVALAGHNRGVNNHFGKIHTLKAGDTITLTTALGTRSYAVTSVTKVAVTDTSGLSATWDNQITLYTCVKNQPEYRWCVKAQEM